MRDAVQGVAAGLMLQVLLGLPFLVEHPKSYLLRAFEFSRVFTFKWSVNWQFLPLDVFLSQRFAVLLLLLHLRLLWSFSELHWYEDDFTIYSFLNFALIKGLKSRFVDLLSFYHILILSGLRKKVASFQLYDYFLHDHHRRRHRQQQQQQQQKIKLMKRAIILFKNSTLLLPPPLTLFSILYSCQTILASSVLAACIINSIHGKGYSILLYYTV